MNVHLVFDLLAAAGALALTYALSRSVLAPSIARIERIGWVYYVAMILGAVWGAYVIGTLNLWISDIQMIGRSILGAFIGSIVMVELTKVFVGVRQSTGALFVPAFTVSTIVGRWGCFFSGLPDQTYGILSDHPFGVDFGDGPRHPVQLYESASMSLALLAWLVLMRRNPSRFRRYGFYLLCIYYGGQRFLLEFLKPYGTLVGPLNLFHFCCAALVVYGTCMIIRARPQT